MKKVYNITVDSVLMGIYEYEQKKQLVFIDCDYYGNFNKQLQLALIQDGGATKSASFCLNISA